MSKGKLFLVISAFIYGINPVFAKGVYQAGANGVTLTMLRALMVSPLLLTLNLAKGISLKLKLREFLNILALSVVGNSMSLICLYVSYSYISVGLATVLHYIYPLIILLVFTFFYKSPLTKYKLFSVLLVTFGVFMFLSTNEKLNFDGVILAVISGFLYAFYVIFLDKSGLDKMNYLKLTFYLSIISSVVIFIFAKTTDTLVLDISYDGWILSGVISLLCTGVSLPLFQLGVKSEGATVAGVISTIEPITGVIAGAIFLNEAVTFNSIIGSVLIISGVLVVEFDKSNAFLVRKSEEKD